MCCGEKPKKIVAFSVLIGLIITLFTSLFVNADVIGEFPKVRFVSIPMLGMSYWGLPLPWLRQVVYPGATKQVIWAHFIVDLIFWIAVVFAAKIMYCRCRMRKISTAKKRKRTKGKGASRSRKPKRTRKR